jgi:hypothetical protein
VLCITANLAADVADGSEADILGGLRDVRFTPKADIGWAHWDVRFVPLTSDLRLDAPQQSLLRYSMRPAAAYAI